jgi:hypothetical protein
MATIDVGKIKFTWRSAFSTSNTYEKDDVVEHSGSSWVYVNAANKTGSAAGAPSSSNSSHWELMAEGGLPTTTDGDIIVRHSGSNVRLPIGSQGQALTVQNSSTVGYSDVEGFTGYKPLTSNLPDYANVNGSNVYGTDGSRPWLARYNGKSGATADWIPQHPFALQNYCGPVKHDATYYINNTPGLRYLSDDHQLMTSGYGHYGLGPVFTAGFDEQINQMCNLSTEFGSLEDGEYFVRFCQQDYTIAILTNKGNVFVGGYNGYGQLGLGDTTDRYQIVKNPYLGPNATNNGITMEVSCIVCNDPRGYQGMTLANFYVITHDGRVFCWGYNGYSMLGTGNTTNQNKPVLLDGNGFGNNPCVMLSTGFSSVYAVDDQGQGWFVGYDYNGHSTFGSGVITSTINSMSGVTDVKQIQNANTYYYNGGIIGGGAYIKSNGNLYIIGYNGNYNSGMGDTTARTSWVQADSSYNYAAIHSVGAGSTFGWCGVLGNVSSGNSGGVDGPGDAYTYMQNSNQGLAIRTAGYNANGWRMEANTSTTATWTTPNTTTYDSMPTNAGSARQKQSVTSSGNVLSGTDLTFPRAQITRVWPVRNSGYQAMSLYMLDNQKRMWFSGYCPSCMHTTTNTGAVNMDEAHLDEAPWNHSGAINAGRVGHFWGKAQPSVKEWHIEGHYYSGYYHYTVVLTDGTIWMKGNNYYYSHGSNQNVHYYYWHRRSL